MTKKKAVVFVHGVGPAEDGQVLQSFLADQGDQLISAEMGSRFVSGDKYPYAALPDGLILMESGWSLFRPVQRGTFAIFFETLALVWGMLRLASFDTFAVGSEERPKNILGAIYVWSFIALLFWCIHPAIISLFFTIGDYTAVLLWTVSLGVVTWFLGRYDKIFFWGAAWIVSSLLGCALVELDWIDEKLLIGGAAWAYVIAQFATISFGWLFMLDQVRRYWTAPLPIRAARLAIAFVPFFAASGLGALVWTLALGRAQAVQSSTSGILSFDQWAEHYSGAIFYPVFNAEMYNGSVMFLVGCLLLIPPLWTFLNQRSRKSLNTAKATRGVISNCLFLSGLIVLIMVPLFQPAMIVLPDMSWLVGSTYTEGEKVFAAYATWSTRVLPFLPFFFGGLAIVLKIIGDVVFYLLPPSDQVTARGLAIKKLKKIMHQLIDDDYSVLIISHSQGTMIALDAVGSVSREGGSLKRVGLWLSGSPSAALYHEFLQLNRLGGPLPGHVRNFYREDDVIAGPISDELSPHPRRDQLDFKEERFGFGGHLDYWRQFHLADVRFALTDVEAN